MFEGLLIGAIGAVIPLGILYLVYEKAIHYILEKFHLLQNIINFLPVTQAYRTLLPVGILFGSGNRLCRKFLYNQKTSESIITYVLN